MQAVFDLLARCQRPLLIIGGHALDAHGVSRQTADVDCLIASGDRAVLDELLRGGGFSLTGGTENFARYAHKSPLLPEVDVLFVDAATFAKLHPAAIPFRNNKQGLRVPALAHLVALKLHAIRNNPLREARDLGDIAELLRVNPGSVSSAELAALCDQFGPPGIEARLKSLAPP